VRQERRGEVVVDRENYSRAMNFTLSIDCTGSNSLLRDHVVPPVGEVVDGGANTVGVARTSDLVTIDR
jgi:hypothetical protein